MACTYTQCIIILNGCVRQGLVINSALLSVSQAVPKNNIEKHLKQACQSISFLLLSSYYCMV